MAAEPERIPMSEIVVGDFVPAGAAEWTRVCQVDRVRDRVLIYLDEDSLLRDDMPLDFPADDTWVVRRG